VPETQASATLQVQAGGTVDVETLVAALERLAKPAPAPAAAATEIPAATGGEPSPSTGAPPTTHADADAEAFLRALLAHTKETQQ